METPPIDRLGFVRVPPQGGSAETWLQCNACQKRERFWIEADRVRCSCGAAYDHAAVEQVQVPVSELSWVPFDKGPVQLAEMEVDWRRIGALLLVLALAAGVISALLS
ncbi:MAG: hypothetical protein ACI9VR_004977 [Cognaticolwellia sp.]|jgi:hypothetical protein